MTATFDLDTIHLATGGHGDPSEGTCLLEAASMFAAEPFSDKPSCVSPLLRDAGIALNDCITDQDERDALKDLIPIIVGTAGDGLDPRRAAIAWAFYVNRWVPAWLRLNPDLADEAAALEAVDTTDREATLPLLTAAQAQANAAWSAAESAAWSAAESAAWNAAWSAAESAAESAAWSAARSAARSAAWSAARSAARSAAESAAWSAARSALQDTSDRLRAEFTGVYREMATLTAD